MSENIEDKKFLAAWGSNFAAPCLRVVNGNFFDGSIGYTADDIEAINNLSVGESHRDAHYFDHSVMRVPDHVQMIIINGDSIPLSGKTNNDRAELAKQSVSAFIQLSGNTYPDDEADTVVDAMADLITDLLHMAGKMGVAPEDMIDRAKTNHDLDLVEEGDATEEATSHASLPVA